MAAYLEGDHAAFGELFARLYPLLLGTMLRNLPDREEAHDLVQQTFLQVHRARRSFEPGAHVRPWVFTIAMNLKRDHYRMVKRKRTTPLDLDGRNDPPMAPLEPERIEAQHVLAWGLEHLDHRHRAAIELHWFEGLSFAEVGLALGAPKNTVKVWAHRGYAGLRRVIVRDSPPPRARLSSSGLPI